MQRKNNFSAKFHSPIRSLLLLGFIALISASLLVGHFAQPTSASAARPNAELYVTAEPSEKDCCWEFKLFQKWGTAGNITKITAQITTPGVTVKNASNAWTTQPTYTSNQITWTTPTPLGLNPSEKVSACFSTTGPASVTIVFTGYDSLGNPAPGKASETVVIDVDPAVC